MSEILDLVRNVTSPLLAGHVPPVEALKLLVSKLLGFAILAGACITKLPQILNVVRSKSAEGLSALSFELEALVLIIHTSYGALSGLPFSSYGEAGILCCQSLLLLCLVYYYSAASRFRATAVLGLLSALVAAVILGQVSMQHVQLAFDFNNVLNMGARLPQIYKNFRAQATGQLSLTTSAINTLGAVIRIFTSLTDKAGAAMVRTYVLSLIMNSTLLAQILYFGPTGRTRSKLSKLQKLQKKKN